MKLSPEQIRFEDKCRSIFLGQTIRVVLYGELKYFMDIDGKNINPIPSYKTKYSAIDSLDYSIYFKTDDGCIYITWDATFFSYGLIAEQINFTQAINDYEQRWDVSADGMWATVIGQRINNFNIGWERTWEYFNTEKKRKYQLYPQTFEIGLESGEFIVISASELKNSETEYSSMMDNLLVTKDKKLLDVLVAIEKKAIRRLGLRSIWRRLFGSAGKC